jgi:hypothetical protein
MSHLSECVNLYRYDTLVTHAQYGRIIEDAIERDRLEADAAEAPEPEPDTEPDTGQAAPVDFSPLTEAERDQVNSRVRSIITAKIANERPTAEESAAIVLANFERLADITDDLGRSIEGLIALDDVRRDAITSLEAAVTFLNERMNLRADELRALDRRIDNVRILASGGRDLRPA